MAPLVIVSRAHLLQAPLLTTWLPGYHPLQVPLFPLERPLLPGSERDLKLSASERYALLYLSSK